MSTFVPSSSISRGPLSSLLVANLSRGGSAYSAFASLISPAAIVRNVLDVSGRSCVKADVPKRLDNPGAPGPLAHSHVHPPH